PSCKFTFATKARLYWYYGLFAALFANFAYIPRQCQIALFFATYQNCSKTRIGTILGREFN
ncbi:MAG TPA: hypothetical protein VHN12_11275, partial [Geobacteraceae bacterium]|nr:hypothetical protein [Geobacteraceae bacterium]